MIRYSTEEIRRHIGSSIMSDALDSLGYRDQMIAWPVRPLGEDTFLDGPAFTSIGTQVYSMPPDPLTAQCKVVDQLSEGEVYVLVIRGTRNCAVFGELFAAGVHNRKGAGVLTDGYARDIRQLKEMGFPLFYGGTDPRTSKGRCEINECQIPVVMQGVTIRPGDIILGDIDGVAVIPQEIAGEAFDRAFETVDKEKDVRAGLQGGASLREMYALNGAI